MSRAELSDATGAGLGGAETAIELVQELRVRPWLTLRPDVQWIVDPSGQAGPCDALVLTLRVELGW